VRPIVNLYNNTLLCYIWHIYCETYMKLILQCFTLIYMTHLPWNLYETCVKPIWNLCETYVKLILQCFTLIYEIFTRKPMKLPPPPPQGGQWIRVRVRLYWCSWCRVSLSLHLRRNFWGLIPQKYSVFLLPHSQDISHWTIQWAHLAWYYNDILHDQTRGVCDHA